MELTSKQRAQLRGLANSLTPIVHIGKEGITEAVVKQTDEALEARELIKCRVLESALLTAREACDELAQRHPQRGRAGHRQQVRPLFARATTRRKRTRSSW